jgi:phage tail-like protein
MRIALIFAVLVVAAPAAQRPTTAARFAITIDGVEFAVFSELAGISSTVDVVESSSETERINVAGLVSLGRPLTTNLTLAKWHEEAVANGPRIRKNMVLIVFGRHGAPVARYHLENAWPAKIEIGGLKAGASEVLMETVTLACERIERVAP